MGSGRRPSSSFLSRKHPDEVHSSSLFSKLRGKSTESFSVGLSILLVSALVPLLVLLLSYSIGGTRSLYPQTSYPRLLLLSGGAGFFFFLLLRCLRWLCDPLLQWKGEEGSSLSSFLHADHQSSRASSSCSSPFASESSSSLSSSSPPLPLSFPVAKAEEACLDLPPTLNLSVVVPAYNEALRLPSALCELICHLESRRAASSDLFPSLYQSFSQPTPRTGTLPAHPNTPCSPPPAPPDVRTPQQNQPNETSSSSAFSFCPSSSLDNNQSSHVSSASSPAFSTSLCCLSPAQDLSPSPSAHEEGSVAASRERGLEATKEPSRSDRPGPFEYEIIVVDDGSEDQTPHVVFLLASAIYSPTSSPSASQAAEAARHALHAIAGPPESTTAKFFSSSSSFSFSAPPVWDRSRQRREGEENEEEGARRKGEGRAGGETAVRNDVSKKTSERFVDPSYPLDSSPVHTGEEQRGSRVFQAIRAATFYHLRQKGGSSSPCHSGEKEAERKESRDALLQTDGNECQEKDICGRGAGTRTEVEVNSEGRSSGLVNTRSRPHDRMRFLPATSPSRVRVIRLRENRGKGFAVKTGAHFARGELILMADADGATKVGDLASLEEALEKLFLQQTDRERTKKKKQSGKREEGGGGEGQEEGGDGDRRADANSSSPFLQRDSISREQARERAEGQAEGRKKNQQQAWRSPMVAFGSRRHLEAEAVVSRAWYRNFLMHAFHWCVACVVEGRGGVTHDQGRFGPQRQTVIRDTQCGFKLFTRQAARSLFPHLHISRWAFDVELLLLSRLQNIPVVEVPVEWTEKEGSKLNILGASFQMARDLLVLKLMYALGVWGGHSLRPLPPPSFPP